MNFYVDEKPKNCEECPFLHDSRWCLINWYDVYTPDEVKSFENGCPLQSLEEYDKQLLEEQLKNAIVPKFRVGDVLYYIFRDSVEFMRVYTISQFRDKEKDVFYGNGFGIYWNENELFATKEEAEAKLKEMIRK